MANLMFALFAPMLLDPDPALLEITGDRTIDASVWGVPARIRMDPGAPSMPVFNPDFAARAGFVAGPFPINAKIGPVKLVGRSAVVRIQLPDGELQRRVTWFDADFLKGADASMGPGTLPAPVVRFQLRARRDDERYVSVPLHRAGISGLGTVLEAGGVRYLVQFTLAHELSLATAPLGARIAEQHDGVFDRAPIIQPIFFSVERPIRHMRLKKPLQIGPLRITDMHVRTSDFGSASAIPDANDPPPDPDELVVTGRKKQKGQATLLVGRDYLSRCSSITFDKPAKKIWLSCR